MADAPPPAPTYHVYIWTEPMDGPPDYVCLLCVPPTEAYRGTLEQVTAHLQTVHQADAIPTPMMDQMLAQRAEVAAAAAATATSAESPAPQEPSPTPPPEDPAHG
jgi:hypothetical protein